MNHSVHPTADEWLQLSDRWGWSERERDVVRLIVTGEARKDAALSLNITQSTLQTHLRRALWKAAAKDLVALVWKIVAERDRLRR